MSIDLKSMGAGATRPIAQAIYIAQLLFDFYKTYHGMDHSVAGTRAGLEALLRVLRALQAHRFRLNEMGDLQAILDAVPRCRAYIDGLHDVYRMIQERSFDFDPLADLSQSPHSLRLDTLGRIDDAVAGILAVLYVAQQLLAQTQELDNEVGTLDPSAPPSSHWYDQREHPTLDRQHQGNTTATTPAKAKDAARGSATPAASPKPNLSLCEYNLQVHRLELTSLRQQRSTAMTASEPPSAEAAAKLQLLDADIEDREGKVRYLEIWQQQLRAGGAGRGRSAS